MADYINNARQFVDVFAEPISQSILHIYLSALVFTPSSSSIYRDYHPLYLDHVTFHQPNIMDWQSISPGLNGHSDLVYSMAFSGDCKVLASGSGDGSVRLWDVQTGAGIGKAFQGHSGSVTSVIFSPNGAIIASSSSDRTIRLWDVKTGAERNRPFRGHSDSVNSVTFSPSGALLASGSSDKTIRLWSTEVGDEISKPFQGHSDSVTSVTFSPSGGLLASGSNDHTIRLWSVKTGSQISLSSQPVNYVPMSLAGTLIALSEPLRDLIHYTSMEYSASSVLNFQGHSECVTSVAFSPDGRSLVSRSDDNTVRLWRVSTGDQIGSPFQSQSSTTRCVAFYEDSTILAACSDDDTIRLRDVETGAEIGQLYQGQFGGPTSAAFSSDGTLLASASMDRTIRLWDRRTDIKPEIRPIDSTHDQDSIAAVRTSHELGLLTWSALDSTIFQIASLPLMDAQEYLKALLATRDVRIKDSWIMGPNNELIIWIPPVYRNGLQLPG